MTTQTKSQEAHLTDFFSGMIVGALATLMFVTPAFIAIVNYSSSL